MKTMAKLFCLALLVSSFLAITEPGETAIFGTTEYAYVSYGQPAQDEYSQFNNGHGGDTFAETSHTWGTEPAAYCSAYSYSGIDVQSSETAVVSLNKDLTWVGYPGIGPISNYSEAHIEYEALTDSTLEYTWELTYTLDDTRGTMLFSGGNVRVIIYEYEAG